MDINNKLIVEKLNSLQTPLQVIKLAAYLGNTFAQEKLGFEGNSANKSFTEWVYGLHQWKKAVLVKTCLLATQASFPILTDILEMVFKNEKYKWQIESYTKIISIVKRVIESTEDWLIYQDDNIMQSNKIDINLKEIVDMVTFWVYDFGSDRENKAYYIVNAAFNTVSAASWNYKTIKAILLTEDNDELVAKIIDGPAFETVQAVDYARLALQISEDAMRKLICEGLLTWVLQIQQ